LFILLSTDSGIREDKERQERLLEKKKRMGMAIPGEQLTMKEREARIWRFMNYKVRVLAFVFPLR
jgi:hypothetical protein